MAATDHGEKSLRASYMKGGGISEALLLYRANFGDITAKVTAQLGEARNIEKLLAESLGERVADKHLLEVGPGPHGAMTHFFAVRNECTGIDIEVAHNGGLITAFFADLRASGPSRAARNTVKRVLGLNRRYAAELRRQLEVDELRGETRRMDATDLDFESGSFDAVFSLSAFEHIPDPEEVIKEIARVLRPGGSAVIITHFITSDSGIHDPRLFGERQDLPWWAHLRRETKHLVKPNCYVNWLRVGHYKEMFEREWPGAEFRLWGATVARERELAKLRSRGELQAYSDEELLNDVLVTIWKKPDADHI